jgi:hypothetical protein
MEIRFVSSLTPDDEARIARVLTLVLGNCLDQFPLVYSLRITTSIGSVTERFSALEVEVAPPKAG